MWTPREGAHYHAPYAVGCHEKESVCMKKRREKKASIVAREA